MPDEKLFVARIGHIMMRVAFSTRGTSFLLHRVIFFSPLVWHSVAGVLFIASCVWHIAVCVTFVSSRV